MSNKQYISSIIVLFFLGLTYYSSQYFPWHKQDDIGNNSDSQGFDDGVRDSHDDHNTNDNVEHPIISKSDLIYDHKRNTVPIVNEEYSVIFFQVAKVASSEWTRFFIRLNNDPVWCSNKRIHDHQVNGLKYLSDYSTEEAQKMMTSPKWKKAIFVRHPKPRILSAFLDKAVEHSRHFITETCRVYWSRKNNYDDCLNKHENFDFFLKEITTTLKDNVHWRSIFSRIDEKWWPYIDFVGNMENISEDAETFLKSIHSNASGISAWDKIGTSGWSDNERDCEKNAGDKPFLAKKDTHHQTNAREKMLNYYTPELEEFVEEHYADDLNNPYFQFEPIELFNKGKK